MGWLIGLVHALAYLCGSPRALPVNAGQGRPPRLTGQFVLVSLAWGLVLVLVWETTYRLAWPAMMNWAIPAFVTAGMIVLGTCHLAARSLVRLLGRGLLVLVNTTLRRRAEKVNQLASRPLVRGLLLWLGLFALTAAVALLLNAAFRWWDPDWPTQLASPWAWLWPRAMHRLLLLMPMWGLWAMLALIQFHRPNAATDAATTQLAETTGPVAMAAVFVLPLAGSFVYLMFLNTPMRFVPPAAGVVTALAGGSLLIRASGGLCRPALLAANLLTQLAFLAGYVAVR